LGGEDTPREMESEPGGCALRLHSLSLRQGYDAVNLRNCEALFGAAGPMYFNFVDGCGVAQAEVQPRIACGCITATGDNIAALRMLLR